MDKNKGENMEKCDFKKGTLPECAPLTLAYVPMQQSAEPAYDPEDALKRGTLFPGLDLPFMNMVNTADMSGTPLGEVMALQFVCHELHLYLDTLFPGLDLPFMNMVNTADMSGTPLGEVMALQFVCHELHLYLDTHQNDAEAFMMLKKMLALSREAEKRYTAKFGPLCPKDLEYSSKFDWLEDPWPWMYQK